MRVILAVVLLLVATPAVLVSCEPADVVEQPQPSLAFRPDQDTGWYHDRAGPRRWVVRGVAQ